MGIRIGRPCRYRQDELMGEKFHDVPCIAKGALTKPLRRGNLDDILLTM